MIKQVRRCGFIGVVLCLAACSGVAPVVQSQTVHFVSNRVDVSGLALRENRPMIDAFAMQGPYAWVEIAARSEADARMVGGWLREDGIPDVRSNVSGGGEAVTLTGYWPQPSPNAH
ncbi:hypothetical protein [Paraburkholderia sp. J8-2]|uniref:hypothetical protein n=1 Tax=Paraburkholderia sp. J8-2 TaxID=2805440 RepID=UPI002AB7022B|nr:hypothetical protein [Paraburkholderia sp. J8-2]